MMPGVNEDNNTRMLAEFDRFSRPCLESRYDVEQ